MYRSLLIAVHFHDGRYHGAGDWPPAPARLFQALVAGAARCAALADEDRRALCWLEQQDPPVIAAPAVRAGQGFELYVPNNDLDAKGDDVGRIAEVRGAIKRVRPRLFDAAVPLLYAWRFDAEDGEPTRANGIGRLANRLYQLGRGVDMAWATADILEPPALEERLAAYPGAVHRPGRGRGAVELECPVPGSLASLEDRFRQWSQRLRADGTRTLFVQPPKALFVQVGYGCQPRQFLFEIRSAADDRFAPWPSDRTTSLVERLRDGAYARLKNALPSMANLCDRVIVGRNAGEADKAQRVRIVPLPSIGHEYVDRAIRRVLIEVPPNCPLPADDIAWAFSGLEVEPGTVDRGTGEIVGLTRLVRTADASMAQHYGIEADHAHRLWRSVTPVVVPESAARRRIDPTRRCQEAKGAAERQEEERRASQEVIQALRHAGVSTPLVGMRVQREPFSGWGARAEVFAAGTRFARGRLWHVEIAFAAPLAGPLVIGDGRYLGLGLMAPSREQPALHVFVVRSGLTASADPFEVARALRRAVMARVQAQLGRAEALPLFFSGHEPDGSPARSRQHAHLAFAFDPRQCRLLVVAPHLMDGRTATQHERDCLAVLDEALLGLSEIRAGSSGFLHVEPASMDSIDDRLLRPSKHWESVTVYHVTRHAKRGDARGALDADIHAECRRRGLPAPAVNVLEARGIRGVGLVGRARLTFHVAVHGPILLGRTRHLGGGLFESL